MARTVDLQRRSELVHQALAVLRVRGGRLTMTELARALGVKRPTLYFYFRDLTGLLHAAVEDVYRTQIGHLVGRVAGVDHPVRALGELARATVELQGGRRDLILLLIQLWAAGGSDLEELLVRGRTAAAPLRAELVSRLILGVERGVVAPCEPARVVDLVLAVLDGVLLQEITRGASGTPVVEELWQRVLAPLIVAPPAPPSSPPKPPRPVRRRRARP